MTYGTSENLIRALKRLGVLDTTIRDYFSRFPERAGTGVILAEPNGKPVPRKGRVFFDAVPLVTEADVRDFVEDNIAWMYGDGRGFVTVGIGHLAENLGEAQEINLENKHTGAPATPDEIAHDFEAAEGGTSDYHLDYGDDAVLRLAAGEEGRRNAF
jgi:hypothetical protein